MILVLKAQANPGGQKEETDLILALTPIFRAIAWKIVSQASRDDAVQEALIKVWRKIGYIDPSRPSTIKPLIMKIGVEAMRDVRRVEMRRNQAKISLEAGEFEPPDCKQRDREWAEKDFPPFFRRYVRYIRLQHEMLGAHAAFARTDRKKIAWVTTRFHKEAKVFRAKHAEAENATGSEGSKTRRRRRGSKPPNDASGRGGGKPGLGGSGAR